MGIELRTFEINFKLSKSKFANLIVSLNRALKTRFFILSLLFDFKFHENQENNVI